MGTHRLPDGGCSADAYSLAVRQARGREAQGAELGRARPAGRAGGARSASASLGPRGLLQTGLSPTRFTSLGHREARDKDRGRLNMKVNDKV